jgi:hypothetical protein
MESLWRERNGLTKPKAGYQAEEELIEIDDE